MAEARVLLLVSAPFLASEFIRRRGSRSDQEKSAKGSSEVNREEANGS